MNKADKMCVAVLVAALVGSLYWTMNKPKPQPQPTTAPAATVQVTPQAPAEITAPTAPAEITAPSVQPAEGVSAQALPAEEFFVLRDDKVVLTLSSHGARVVKAELLGYKAENTDDASHVELMTGNLLETRLPDQMQPSVYTLKAQQVKSLTLATTLPNGVTLERTLTLEPNYAISVTDTFLSATTQTVPGYTFNAGMVVLSKEKGDVLGADALAVGESKPIYYGGELGKLLGAGSAFLGCGTTSDPTGVELMRPVPLAGAQTWIALKNRFFVTLTQPPAATNGTLFIRRDPGAKTLTINVLDASFEYPAVELQAGVATPVKTRLYIGPKKLADLKAFGSNAGRVMDFGFFTWVCELLLPLLNGFYWLINNYGIAIILLTIFVRILFWPLTRKSTLAMRKMSTIQPLIKEVQQKFKDQPQKIQQETFKLYREHKVNPFSSCLPMLIQIPIFIALFVVLQSAVELRFASFLWISDLSQPENLFADFLPVPLNILPILTAVTMGLQTHMSPSSGDPAQKKMMTWMMPIMLLFMFYQMASALCLYWTMSQLLSILQTLQIQRQTAKKN